MSVTTTTTEFVSAAIAAFDAIKVKLLLGNYGGHVIPDHADSTAISDILRTDVAQLLGQVQEFIANAPATEFSEKDNTWTHYVRTHKNKGDANLSLMSLLGKVRMYVELARFHDSARCLQEAINLAEVYGQFPPKKATCL